MKLSLRIHHQRTPPSASRPPTSRARVPGKGTAPCGTKFTDTEYRPTSSGPPAVPLTLREYVPPLASVRSSSPATLIVPSTLLGELTDMLRLESGAGQKMSCSATYTVPGPGAVNE